MTEESTKQVTFKIQRYDPERGNAPHFQEFMVPVSPLRYRDMIQNVAMPRIFRNLWCRLVRA